ncbi:MAG: hypothetical protein A2Y25_04235 [Candidatus Melainabacteria bacterium GWF2_37_15]|nr:MAG: hypothetical protein A2Y25_04235 [Candidatus Melainabacteria bacterium GWF2_37_15]
MNLDILEKIKKLSIRSLFSDDVLMERLVLKGGNCIDLAYKLSTRSSLDLDFSMETDFTQEEIDTFTDRIEFQFNNYFPQENLRTFDIKFSSRPMKPDKYNDWGGYRVTFKVIPVEKYQELQENKDKCRKQSLTLGKNDSKEFSIDISKFEYCQGKQSFDLDGVNIYIYSPLMTVFEKLRAICQKMKEYDLNSARKDQARSRDFYDIFIVNEELAQINFKDSQNRELLKEIFQIKKVPLHLLEIIKDKREVHRLDFESVKATITHTAESFDFYFDYVLEKVDELERFWNV